MELAVALFMLADRYDVKVGAGLQDLLELNLLHLHPGIMQANHGADIRQPARKRREAARAALLAGRSRWCGH